MRWTKSVGITAVLACAIVLPACGGGGRSGASGGNSADQVSGVPQSLVDAACKDGALQVFQMPLTPAVDEVNNAFRAAYPCIRVSSLTGVGGTILARFQSTVSSGQEPDVLELSLAGSMEQLAKQNTFSKFTPVQGNDVKSSVPGYTVYDYGLQMGVLYNTKSVSASDIKPLASWCDIAKPEFSKYKFGLISPAAGGTAETTWYYIFQNCGGAQFVKNFVATHQVTKFASAEPAATAITSGQVDILLPDAANASLPVWKSGAPVQWAIPSPVVATSNTLAIPAKAKHKSAAELYIDFMLSPVAQRLYNVDDFTTSGNATVTASNPVTQQDWWHVPSDTFTYDPVVVNAATGTLTDLFNSAS